MNSKKKRIGILICTAILSAILSIAVLAVAGYDSTADPLISQSYLIKYIQENVLSPQNAKNSELEGKIATIEKALDALLGGYIPPAGGTESGGEASPPSSPEYTETLDAVLRLSEKLSALEAMLNDLTEENSKLSGKYDSLSKENQSVKAENEAIRKEIENLRQQLNDYVEENSKEELNLLKEQYSALLSEVAALKSSTSSIQASFTDISKSYVALQKEVYNLNLTLKELSDSDSTVFADLLQLSSKVTELGTTLNALATKNMTFEMICLEKGDRIVANGSVSVMLQFGEATALSPKNELGTYMEFTDLTSGALIGDGDVLPLNHNVFIPGNGRTAILCTGEHGIYIFVGGDYTVVKAEPVA